MLTSEIKSEVNQILEHDVGDLAKWKALCGYFLDKKICYYTTIKVQDMLVHGQNRGGSGISVHNALAKGQIILTAGCDPTLLQNSTCFEINPGMTKRAAQTACSESLWKAHQDFFCKAPWRREVPFSVIISFLPVLQGYSFRLQVSNCRADGCQWQNVSCFAFS